VLLLTGARPGEITPAVISPEFRLAPDGTEVHESDLEAFYPTIRVPRAKGDRGAIEKPLGRLILLPTSAVEVIRKVPRSDSVHAFPEDLPGEPIRRLAKVWGHLLEATGIPHVPLKTTRPSWRTHAADCDISQEHAQLFMATPDSRSRARRVLEADRAERRRRRKKIGAYIARLLDAERNNEARSVYAEVTGTLGASKHGQELRKRLINGQPKTASDYLCQ
jgi:integrase